MSESQLSHRASDRYSCDDFSLFAGRLCSAVRCERDKFAMPRMRGVRLFPIPVSPVGNIEIGFSREPFEGVLIGMFMVAIVHGCERRLQQ